LFRGANSGDRQAGTGSAHASYARGDIFPALEIFIGCGAFTYIIVGLLSHSAGSLLIQVASSTGFGAILRLFMGLSRGVWRLRETLSLAGPPTTSDRL
jgi:hypothetical protein